MHSAIPAPFPWNFSLKDKMINEAVVGLGSNIDPETHLEQAVHELGSRFSIIKKSSWLRTTPIGIRNQPDFINGALLLGTEMEQKLLKDTLREIDDKLGRDRSQSRLGPRVIDLDIVVWNGKIVDEDYHERDFLRENIAQIMPELEVSPSS